jgi:Tfp pilus assembly protein PilV
MRLLNPKKQIREFLKNSRGFSLIEIIIILVILAITLLPLSQLSVTNTKAGAIYVSHTRAMFLAQGLMEQIIADYNSDSATLGGYDNVVANWSSNSGLREGLAWTVTISSESLTYGVRYRTVTVYASNTGVSGGITLKTLIVK